MQDYEKYTRISRAPVIIPPAGAAPVQEAEEPFVENEPAAEEPPVPPDLFRVPVFHTSGRKPGGADRLLLAQTVLCGLVLATLLFLRASSPAVFETVRQWYTEEIGREITVQVETVSPARES